MVTETREGFRLSPQQRRLWSLQWDYQSYLTQGAILIEGDLCSDALRSALERAFQRHEIFRTTFQTLPGINFPIQIIDDAVSLDYAETDLSFLPVEAEGYFIKQHVREEKARVFDFERGPLSRCCLFKLAPDRHVLIVTLPALCADLVTLHTLTSELSSCYGALMGQHEALEEPTQYADLAEWQSEILESETTTGRNHWLQKDYGALAGFRLPFEKAAAEGARFEPELFNAPIPVELSERIGELAQAQGVGMEVILLAGWQALLWRLTGMENIFVGVTSKHRKYEELKGACGQFAKDLPVECRLDGMSTFGDLMRQTEEALRESTKWEEYFNWDYGLTDASGAEARPSLPVSFSFDEYPDSSQAAGVTFSLQLHFTCSDRFKVRLSCHRSGSHLLTEWHYDASLVGVEDVKRLSAMYLKLLARVICDPDALLGEIDLLSDVERHRLLVEFNETKVELGIDTCLQRLFEHQAEKTPEAVALVYEGEQISYAELNSRANRLARHLSGHGCRSGSLVGVCLERSAEMVSALLGVLKAGAAYVPLDPTLPKARLSHIIEDAGITVLLTQESVRERLPEHGVKTVCLDTDDWQASGEETNPSSFGLPDDLAYVIYTSGSTGKPKGVMISHRAICNRLLWGQTVYPLKADDRVLQISAFGFDFSVWEIFAPLSFGAGLVLPGPGGHQDTAYLVRLIAEQKVTTAHFVPTLFGMFLEEPGLESCESLRRIFCGGEALSPSLRDKCFTRLRADLYNQYGPTEATVDATFYLCVPEEHQTCVPIGRPIANTQVYILDEHLHLAPIGVTGELHIGGAGLARGYVGRPDLTAEKFVPDPFEREPGARLYKSGDLARYLPDGNIELLGRIDHQVKVRGTRIELGEIESWLSQHPAVRESVAAVREDTPGDKRLVAYIVPATEHEAPTHAELHGFMRERVPEYMIPSTFVVLSALPLTASGKVDRLGLPAPDQSACGAENVYVAPRTPIEELLCDLWSQVLGRESIGIHDSFFELGGHSLMAMQLVSKVRESFQIEFPLRALFDAPSIEQLGEIVEQMLIEKLENLTEEEAQNLLAFAASNNQKL
jgi:amino acid adenylation domain-containing protein